MRRNACRARRCGVGELRFSALTPGDVDRLKCVSYDIEDRCYFSIDVEADVGCIADSEGCLRTNLAAREGVREAEV